MVKRKHDRDFIRPSKNIKGVLFAFLVGGLLFYTFHNKIKAHVPFLPEANYAQAFTTYYGGY
jgi:hypothetical protein